MGGRGSASGMSVSGKPYGSEYHTLLKDGNIKFVRYNGSTSAKAPQETMTKGRVYVTVNNENKLAYVTYFDSDNKRRKTIDLLHPHGNINGVHAHMGYEHSEKGTRRLSDKEKQMVERIKKLWYNLHSK